MTQGAVGRTRTRVSGSKRPGIRNKRDPKVGAVTRSILWYIGDKRQRAKRRSKTSLVWKVSIVKYVYLWTVSSTLENLYEF